MQVTYPAIDDICAELIKTKPAAYYLHKAENTLRKWSCSGTTPAGLKPIKIGHHLLWSVAEIKALLRSKV